MSFFKQGQYVGIQQCVLILRIRHRQQFCSMVSFSPYCTEHAKRIRNGGLIFHICSTACMTGGNARSTFKTPFLSPPVSLPIVLCGLFSPLVLPFPLRCFLQEIPWQIDSWLPPPSSAASPPGFKHRTPFCGGDATRLKLGAGFAESRGKSNSSSCQ